VLACINENFCGHCACHVGMILFDVIQLEAFFFALFQINGSIYKEDVFAQIDSVLTELLEQRQATSESLAAK
jgi:hypothetical protein